MRKDIKELLSTKITLGGAIKASSLAIISGLIISAPVIGTRSRENLNSNVSYEKENLNIVAIICKEKEICLFDIAKYSVDENDRYIFELKNGDLMAMSSSDEGIYGIKIVDNYNIEELKDVIALTTDNNVTVYEEIPYTKKLK